MELVMTKDEAIKLIKIELDGICETQGDYDDGWWETYVGAEFGAERLKNVLKIVEALEQPACHKCGKPTQQGHCFYGCKQPAEPPNWNDKEDEWSVAIEQAHPINSNEYELWDIALKMINNRHSKSSLVSLVCWLLVRIHKQPVKRNLYEEIKEGFECSNFSNKTPVE
jgi:hypothetical protein